MDVLCTFKIHIEPKFKSLVYQRPVSNINQDEMQNLGQEPPASSKATYQDLEDMDGLYNFNLKIESQHSEHGSIKDY